MTTLIRGVTSGGRRFRCDARCHRATGEKCACTCGGRFHGVAAQGKPASIEDAEALRLGMDPGALTAEVRARLRDAVLMELARRPAAVTVHGIGTVP